MKTITKVLSALLLSGHNLFAVAQGTSPTDIATLDNAIYMASGSEEEIGSDGSATVSICLKNSVRTTGYQFDLYLPEELAPTATVTKSKVRKEEEYSMTSARQADGAIRVVGYCSDGNAYEGNDGEIATIKFSSVQEGTYSFTFAGMEITSGGISYPISGEIVSNMTFKAKAEEEDPTEDTDISQFENVVYIGNSVARIGGQSVLSLQMNNADPVIGFELKLSLPEGVTVATSVDKYGDTTIGATLMDDRTSPTRHTFETSIVNDKLILLCYSVKNYAFMGNSGEVAQITINVADDVEVGDYPIIIREEAISLDGSTPRIEYLKSTLTIADYKLGDANGDTFVNVGDITTVAGHILGNHPDPFVERSADANEDSFINVGDITTIANIILSGNANGGK